jgi:hypothetical protein
MELFILFYTYPNYYIPNSSDFLEAARRLSSSSISFGFYFYWIETIDWLNPLYAISPN